MQLRHYAGIAALACIALGTASAASNPTDIAESPNHQLAQSLGFSSLVAQRRVPETYAVRVYVEDIYGDCSNPGPACPTQTLHVVAIEGGLQAKLYSIQGARRWTFKRWLEFPPEMPSGGSYVRFEALRQDLTKRGTKTSVVQFRLDTSGLSAE